MLFCVYMLTCSIDFIIDCINFSFSPNKSNSITRCILSVFFIKQSQSGKLGSNMSMSLNREEYNYNTCVCVCVRDHKLTHPLSYFVVILHVSNSDATYFYVSWELYGLLKTEVYTLLHVKDDCSNKLA